MKYQVSLNGKQFEVEVEKGSVSAVPVSYTHLDVYKRQAIAARSLSKKVV